jgi:hypothetical protein
MMNVDAGLKTTKPFNKLPSKLKEKSLDVRTQLVDRLAPLKDLTKGKVKVDADPYVQARLFAGHSGKIQNRYDELSKILTPGKKILPQAKRYAQLEREIELSGRGIQKFEGGRTIEQIKAEKAAMDACRSN